MKAFFVACIMLVCFGCGGPPDTTEPQEPITGVTHPSQEIGSSAPTEGYFNACSAGWQYVTIWVDGQPQSQLQPVICNQGFNPDTGDPMIFKGDPDPTQIEKQFNAPPQKTQH